MSIRLLSAVAALALGLLLVGGCATSRDYVAPRYADWREQAPPDPRERIYRTFLIGDAGAPVVNGRDPLLQLLRRQLVEAGEQAAVIFLGDNIYCCGLPDSGRAGRDRAEARLTAQLEAVKGIPGRIVFLPGNHDWNDGHRGGLDYIRNQERYVEDYLQQGNTFLPDGGLPGPVDLELTDGLRLLVLDTQWWLHPHEKARGELDGYDLEDPGDVLLALDDLLKRHDDDRILVAGHHPLFSVGAHAGYLPARTHLFPFTEFVDWAYLPLPILGSFYPLYVRFLGLHQDLADPQYSAMRGALIDVFRQHGGLVYAAGHEHILQYNSLPGRSGTTQHYFVSGAGARPTPIGRGGGAAFASGGAYGYQVVDLYADGSMWVEAWVLDRTTHDERMIFRYELEGPQRREVREEVVAEAVPSYADSTQTLAANPDYAAGPLKRLLLGGHNREAWTTPVEIPLLDLGTFAGGLTPLKRGGGMQTVSLRLAGADGTEYVLRSVDKDPSATVPEPLQGTVATDVVQDQITSLHPYGALVLPPLASAAGIYHTNPRLVYVPDDPRLGRYRADFGDQVMLLEERPDDDMSDWPSYGGATDVISAGRMYREVNDDNDHRVDQTFFARSRLFDMLVADWDRHRDQWRWAAFEPGELDPTLRGDEATRGKVYRPIPRDRDWAFNRMTGLPSLARFFDPKFQDFDDTYGNLKGLTLNGLEQDRRFTNALTRAEWRAQGEDLAARLTDAVIDSALATWPPEIAAIDGPRVARLLKDRRDALPDVAERYYEILAGVVDIVGSDKHERFVVTRLPAGDVRIEVAKTTKEGEPLLLLYQRTFRADETREIRLFGQGGNDQFEVAGVSSSRIHVRAVGGAGDDRLVPPTAPVRAERITYYDAGRPEPWYEPEGASLVISSSPLINQYDPFGFAYDTTRPLLFFGRNDDDGLFLGGGVNIHRHSFRKVPFARHHQLRANVATRTGAFNVDYRGQYTEVAGRWDMLVDAEAHTPNTIYNYYGLGNTTENTAEDAAFYQAQLQRYQVLPSLLYALTDGAYARVGFGAVYTNVEKSPDRFPGQNLPDEVFDDQLALRIEGELRLEAVDDRINPRRGFRWRATSETDLGLLAGNDRFQRLSTDVTVYTSVSASRPQVTLALRAGIAHTVGDFPFFRAHTLGQRSNLRGYRSTRFAGRTSAYQNAELRLGLLDFSTYLAIGRLGLLAFVDNGRVWHESDPSNRDWHQGYGGGVWSSLFGLFVVNATMGWSDEDRSFQLGAGFLF